MLKGIKSIKNKKMLNELTFYNKPKHVFIPLIVNDDEDITVVVKKGQYIYKGSIIGKCKGKYHMFIHSSVSGVVIDLVSKPYYNGKMVKCLKIENDFKEKIEDTQVARKKIDDFSKDEFLNRLQDCGVVGLSGNGIPTYIKYNTSKRIRTLIVNASECEPYIMCDSKLMESKCEEILEAIDAIMEINNIKEGIIAINKDYSSSIELFDNFIGTYPKIRLVCVPNIYPIGWDKKLVEYVLKTTYHSLPIEKGIVVNNVSTIYAIYEALKYNKPLIERIVTFDGEMIKNPQNIHVKIGTPVSDIIEYIGGYKRNKDVVLVAGGPMMGHSVSSDELIISPAVNCILVLKNCNNEHNVDCNRCGKCVEYCPVKLSPIIIKESLSNKDRLKDLKVNRCIECGLCSSICPSKIDVRKYVKKAKEQLDKEGK